MEKLFLIDALAYVFRAHHALPSMTNDKGMATNALYGFILQIQKILKDFKPEHIAIVFDGPKNKQGRLEIYEEYKAHREKADDDLIKQMALAQEYCELLGLKTLCVEGVEADDVIATLALFAEKQNAHAYICSHDKDLCQLASQNITLINTHKQNLMITPKKVKELFGVAPDQIRDYLALVGDASDNIPGLKGVGPKTAAKWLNEFKTLDNILANKDKVENGKKAALLDDYQEQLEINVQLTTLHHVEFKKSAQDFLIKEPDTEKLIEFYKNMKFSIFLKQLTQESSKKKSDDDPVDYQLIDTEDGCDALIQTLLLAEEICVDVETNHLDPMQASLVGIGFGIKPKQGWYIAFNGKLDPKTIVDKLRILFETKPFFGHNIKYDFLVLKRHGLVIQSICFDTMIASYLLFAHSHRHSLDHLSLEFFGKVKTSIKDLIGPPKLKQTLFDVEIERVKDYCLEDVDYTIRLKQTLQQQLKESKLEHLLFELEIPLLFVLAKMQDTGIFLDPYPLIALSDKLNHKIGQLQEHIFELAGEVFNLNSTQQLGKILFDKLGIEPLKKTKTAYSTASGVLENLQNTYPIAKHVLEYRIYTKLKNTYVDALPKYINPKTKRIHCTFNQTMAATGRLSCHNPNLQNIPIRTPEGLEIRKSFYPQKPGWVYLSADYSQIELRLVAHFSKDPTLVQAFKEGEDIHQFTASMIYNIPEESVTKQQRSFAKAVNFGIIYGQTAYGLSKQLNIDVIEAKTFIKAYFDRYPKVHDFLTQCIEKTKQTLKATTLIGRERKIPEIVSSNKMIQQAAERLAINTPLQGTAADLMKIAMLKIENAFEKEKIEGWMILQIHDEVIFELPESEVERAKPIVIQEMQQAMDLDVPLVVNVNIGKNWKEC
ncbi:MAG: DNA polymerase I [Chlamydiae bacterium]|nr:DNA polymerase I [Chlamydiota bacterium]